MRNLTGKDLALQTPEGEPAAILWRTGERATRCIGDEVRAEDEPLHAQAGDIGTARLQTASPAQVEKLNRLLEEQIRKDAARTGGEGLVLVEREVLEHVHPRLGDRVATPLVDDNTDSGRSEPVISMLLFPARPYAGPGAPPAPKGYTLFLDRAGLCTSRPDTCEIGHAHTWEQLQWLARGAEPFKRGGRLWARDDGRNIVLHMSDIALDGPPAEAERGDDRTGEGARGRGARGAP